MMLVNCEIAFCERSLLFLRLQCTAEFHSACTCRFACRPNAVAARTMLSIDVRSSVHLPFPLLCAVSALLFSGSICAETCMCCTCLRLACFCHGQTHPLPYGMKISSPGLIVFCAIIDIQGRPVLRHVAGVLPLPSRALFV